MRLALTILLVLLLAACGSPAESTGTSPAAATTAPQTVATEPAPAAAATSAPAGTPLAAGSPEATAAQSVAGVLGIPADRLSLVAKEPVEWSDGSLGCPAPGMMYTMAIVPGFKLTFSDGAQTYEVHTDDSGARAVVCENGKPREGSQGG